MLGETLRGRERMPPQSGDAPFSHGASAIDIAFSALSLFSIISLQVM